METDAFYAFFSKTSKSTRLYIFSSSILEKQREGVTAILHLEQLHQ